MLTRVSSGNARRFEADLDRLRFCCDKLIEVFDLERFFSLPNLILVSIKVSSSEMRSKALFSSSASCSFSMEMWATLLVCVRASSSADSS